MCIRDRVEPNERCNIVDQTYWDEDPDPNRNQIIEDQDIKIEKLLKEIFFRPVLEQDFNQRDQIAIIF